MQRSERMETTLVWLLLFGCIVPPLCSFFFFFLFSLSLVCALHVRLCMCMHIHALRAHCHCQLPLHIQNVYLYLPNRLSLDSQLKEEEEKKNLFQMFDERFVNFHWKSKLRSHGRFGMLIVSQYLVRVQSHVFVSLSHSTHSLYTLAWLLVCWYCLEL